MKPVTTAIKSQNRNRWTIIWLNWKYSWLLNMNSGCTPRKRFHFCVRCAHFHSRSQIGSADFHSAPAWNHPTGFISLFNLFSFFFWFEQLSWVSFSCVLFRIIRYVERGRWKSISVQHSIISASKVNEKQNPHRNNNNGENAKWCKLRMIHDSNYETPIELQLFLTTSFRYDFDFCFFWIGAFCVHVLAISWLWRRCIDWCISMEQLHF